MVAFRTKGLYHTHASGKHASDDSLAESHDSSDEPVLVRTAADEYEQRICIVISGENT